MLVKLQATYQERKDMITIGDICPLFFDPIKYKHSNKGQYNQVFKTSDKVLIQVFCNAEEVVTVALNNKVTETSFSIPLSTYNVNESVKMYYAFIPMSEGVFSVSIGELESETFYICDNVGDNILIEYSHKDNNSAFDNIFWNGSTQYKFHFRLVGGFKPSGVSLNVDNEQFVNQKQEIVELYSVPYKTMEFYFGDNDGVPYYVAELINKILCLSHVNIDGKLFVREGNSVPEKVDTKGKKELFTYKINLRPALNDIAGVGGKTEIGSSGSIVGFSINNPQDGEVLVYSRDKSAFKNTHNLDSI